MNDYKFGKFVCQLRTEKGLSQSQLGDMMGVSNKAVSKWEMGVSKPRPAMLAVLASFFGVTVEELLAGERNEEVVKEQEEKDGSVLKLWAGEYRRKKKRGGNAVITAFLLPVLMFVLAGVIYSINPTDRVVGPIAMAAIFLAEAIDIALIFVFYGSALRLKRILYAAYPEQAEEITAMIKPKRESFPMLKWEAICYCIGACFLMVLQILRIVSESVEGKARDAIIMVAITLGISGLVLLVVAFIHYLIRSRRKK